MKRFFLFVTVSLMALTSCSSDKESKVTIVTLDPGHFHAALVQKNSYEQVSNEVYVYAPEGDDVAEHLKRIEGYNTRSESPTQWNENVYLGDDFMEKMIAEKRGNVMVTAGNNGKKTEYIKKTLEAGINVLADKPMAITSENFKLLKECFDIAQKNGVMLYDIMTERHEITTILQRELSLIPAIYGEQLPGSAEDPAIIKESVHHFFKEVSGNPLKRPAWFFDVNQEGEGIVDVTTHLVDLVQWEAFPGEIINYEKEVELIDANRWTTPMTRAEFKQVTGFDEYPDYLQKDVKDDVLNVYCNGDILYKLRGITAKVSVIWNYTFPEGGGDTHYSKMKGSKADLIILQGKEQNYKPELFIELAEGVDVAAYEKELATAFAKVEEKFAGVKLQKKSDKMWQVEIPDSYRVGHEAHFGQVTENFLQYLEDGKLPDWEVPNMLAKYYVTTSALDMAKAKSAAGK